MLKFFPPFCSSRFNFRMHFFSKLELSNIALSSKKLLRLINLSAPLMAHSRISILPKCNLSLVETPHIVMQSQNVSRNSIRFCGIGLDCMVSFEKRVSSTSATGSLDRSPYSIGSSISFSKPFHAFQTRRYGRKNVRIIKAAVEVAGTTISREDIVKEEDPTNNVSDSIFNRIGLKLHCRDVHPLGILKNAIYEYFDKEFEKSFVKFDDLSPIVSVEANFDDVLVPKDHVSRSYNDTYYIDSQTVLRCHTSAHQAELLRKGNKKFLVTGDVYRRDAIDATHNPVFHQMEGFRVFSPEEWEASGKDSTEFAAENLKATLEGLAKHLFGDVEMRWIDTYFPFTDPSFELEIFFQGEWLEVLGCGVTEKKILSNCGLEKERSWAFGLGLERLAMVLFQIPDIRLFWSNDERFSSQFKAGQLGTKFKPFSKYPPCYKDISFWISENFTENNFCEIVRGIAGDLAEEVKLIDNFTNKKGMTSHCYRIVYRSMERSLTDNEVNEIQFKVRNLTESKLGVTIR